MFNPMKNLLAEAEARDESLRQSAPYAQAAAIIVEIKQVETEIELATKKLKEQLKELKHAPALKTDAGKLAVQDQLNAESGKTFTDLVDSRGG